MSTTLLPYSPAHYSTLPSLPTAASSLPTFRASALFPTLGALLIRHNLHHHLSLTLLHAHFPLTPTERLIAFGNVSIPVSTAIALDAPISPLCFRFVADGLAAYEFIHGREAAVDLGQDRYVGFLQELRSVLEKAGLLDVLGVGVRQDDAGGIGAEFTSGRANVVVAVDEMPGADEAVEAVWTFDVADGGAGVDGTEGVPLREISKKCVGVCYRDKANQHHRVHTA